MRRILILIDYRDQFYFSTKHRGACADVSKICNEFTCKGYSVEIKHFYELDLRNNNYAGVWTLYQSSEDPGLLYKSYIEDMLLGLMLQGAILIPEFKYFRAHHNKVFMEVLRDVSDIKMIQNVQTSTFGTYEEYLESKYNNLSLPVVIKPSSGTRSRGVQLLHSKKLKTTVPYKISRSFTFDNLKLLISRIKTGKSFVPMSNNRKKFVIQSYISDLKGDYRVLAYGKKFYVVYRKNRKNSFTASGSGLLDFNVVLPDVLLDFAKDVYLKFNTPFMSLDIGHKGGTFFLFEFQCICLGQFTLEKSTFYYHETSNGRWETKNETPDLEREISTCVLEYIKNYKLRV